MDKIKLPVCECNQCGHRWIPRRERVRICPNSRCHSLLWDAPKRVSSTKEHDRGECLNTCKKEIIDGPRTDDI